MERSLQKRAPIYEALERFRRNRVVPFDVPGHKHGRGNPELVEKLQLRRYLEKMIAAIDHNKRYLRELWENYRPVAPEDVLESLPETYRNRKLLTLEGQGLDLRAWEEADYEQTTWHPEHKVHHTAKGDMVRSKSELSIMNILISKNVCFRYEENLYLVHGTLSPDFSIFVPSENRVKYLEHCGMMSDPGYVRRFTMKLQNYVSSGYIPWRDVFFTFDSGDGKIDSHAIDALIEMYFR